MIIPKFGFISGPQQNVLASLSTTTADVAVDHIPFIKSGVGKKITIANLINDVAGTATSTGLVATSGVLAFRPASLTAATVDVAADSIAIIDASATNVPKQDTIVSLVSGIAGTGLGATSGVLATKTPGSQAVGTILFGATGDCTSVTIGATTYAYNVSPTASLGQWAYGGSASGSATSLAAAINGKTSSPYSATANTDTVHVYANAVGTAGNVTITRTGGAQPATLENLVGGIAAATKQWCMVTHTVTANDVAGAVLVNIPLPFTPTLFTPRIMSTAGALKTTVTDVFTIAATPARIVLTDTGGTHVIAGDVINIIAME